MQADIAALETCHGIVLASVVLQTAAIALPGAAVIVQAKAITNLAQAAADRYVALHQMP